MPVKDGFEQHFQATVHFPLSSAIDEPQQHRQFFICNNFGNTGTRTRAAGSIRNYAKHSAILPPDNEMILSISEKKLNKGFKGNKKLV